MFSDSADLPLSMDSIEAFRELSSNTERAVVAARASERIEIQTSVVVRPGNPSERSRFAHAAVTVDISDGGCMLLSPYPVMPGDIYWLKFSEDEIRIGSLFARCMRTRYVSEESYELGLKFMSSIDLRSLLIPSPSESKTII